MSISDPSLVAKFKGMKKEQIAKEQFGIVQKKIDAQEWSELFKNDELNKEMADGKVFFGFQEGSAA